MAAKKKTTTATSPLLSEAALQALVRFGPQLDALKQLTQNAQDTAATKITSANATAAATRAAVAKAQPVLSKVYSDAESSLGAYKGLADQAVPPAPAGAAPSFLQGAAALESADYGSRLNTAKAAALTDLTNQGVRAEQARTSQVLAANNELATNLSKIGVQQTDLTAQQGAFEASTLGDLQDKQNEQDFTASQNAANRSNSLKIAEGNNATSAANAKLSSDTSLETAQISAANKKTAKAKATLPGGVALATPQQHGAARDKVEEALSEVKPLKAHGVSRSELGQALVNGVASYTKKNADGSTTKVPGVAKVPQLYASVALDLAYNGKVSRANARLLHQRGISVKKLGYGIAKPTSAASKSLTAADLKKAIAAFGPLAPLVPALSKAG